MNKTTCSSDPFPTRLLMSHLNAIVPILQHIENVYLTTGDFPISCKSSIVIPLIKKPSLDREMLKNIDLYQTSVLGPIKYFRICFHLVRY